MMKLDLTSCANIFECNNKRQILWLKCTHRYAHAEFVRFGSFTVRNANIALFIKSTGCRAHIWAYWLTDWMSIVCGTKEANGKNNNLFCKKFSSLKLCKMYAFMCHNGISHCFHAITWTKRWTRQASERASKHILIYSHSYTHEPLKLYSFF